MFYRYTTAALKHVLGLKKNRISLLWGFASLVISLVGGGEASGAYTYNITEEELNLIPAFNSFPLSPPPYPSAELAAWDNARLKEKDFRIIHAILSESYGRGNFPFNIFEDPFLKEKTPTEALEWGAKNIQNLLRLKKIISASLIGPGKRKTYGYLGVFLRVPPSCLVVVTPSDMFSPKNELLLRPAHLPSDILVDYAQERLLISGHLSGVRKAYSLSQGLLSPERLMELTSSISFNEVLLIPKAATGEQISVEGYFVSGENYWWYRQDAQAAALSASLTANLPLYNLNELYGPVPTTGHREPYIFSTFEEDLKVFIAHAAVRYQWPVAETEKIWRKMRAVDLKNSVLGLINWVRPQEQDWVLFESKLLALKQCGSFIACYKAGY